MWVLECEYARPIKDAQLVSENYQDIRDWHMCEVPFVTVDKYPPETPIAPGEMGYFGIFRGKTIVPLVRVKGKEA